MYTGGLHTKYADRPDCRHRRHSTNRRAAKILAGRTCFRPVTNDTGLRIDTPVSERSAGTSPASLRREFMVNQPAHLRTTSTSGPVTRIGERRRMTLPGRLTWRDASGTLRFASVVTRDISDVDLFVECQMPATIPMFRLVHFQLERQGRDLAEVPAVLQGKVLSAVYRVGPYKSSTGTPQGYALRLLVEPRVAAMATPNRLAVAN